MYVNTKPEIAFSGTIPNHTRNNDAIQMVSRGRQTALDETVRDSLARIGPVITDLIGQSRRFSTNELVELCVLEAFEEEIALDASSYQRRCDVARTLFEHTHRTLVIESVQ